MYARTTTIQAQPSCIDDGFGYIRDEVMPALQDMEGYIGLSLLVVTIAVRRALRHVLRRRSPGSAVLGQ